MNLLVLDFETFYSSDFTLKKLTTEEYVRDPRFETLCVGFAGMRNGWHEANEIKDIFEGIEWEETAVLCHHTQFDGLILSHHYGIRPAFWFDTLSMAKLVLRSDVSVSLASLAERFGLAPKTIDYQNFIGKRWQDLSADERQALGDGCARDVELTYQLFQRLIPHVPHVELELIDLTIRMFTEPCIEGDIEGLEKVAADEAAKKQALLDNLGIRESELSSATQFAAILTGLGVEVEYKTTPKGNSIPAVAKTDDFMKELLDDENEIISGLAQARLGIRSSIDETRSGRLARAARRGKLPIYLGYCAAGTTRWGGGDKVNFQNFRRGGAIRKCLRAPEGYLLLIADKSQIECRFLEWEAGEQEALDEFRTGADPYVSIASEFYGRQISKSDKAERGLGKQIRLSCGYGAGGPSIVQTAKRGTYGPSVILTDSEGLAARDLYRRSRPGVVNLWREGDEVLKLMGGPVADETDWIHGTCKVVAHGDGTGKIIGPTGTPMHYTLEWDADERGWMRKTRKGWKRIWGGVVVQNITEMLSRCDLAANVVRVKETFPAQFGHAAGEVDRLVRGLQLAWLTHDEGVWVVKDDSDAPHYLEHVLGFMREPPRWAPDIPLDAEGSLSRTYEK